MCYGRPLLHAWLQLSGYGIGLSSGCSRFESYPVPAFLLCICSFASLLRTLFVRVSIHNIHFVERKKERKKRKKERKKIKKERKKEKKERKKERKERNKERKKEKKERKKINK